LGVAAFLPGFVPLPGPLGAIAYYPRKSQGSLFALVLLLHSLSKLSDLKLQFLDLLLVAYAFNIFRFFLMFGFLLRGNEVERLGVCVPPS